MDRERLLELKEKENILRDLFKGFSRIEKIETLQDPKYYRHKIHINFSKDKNNKLIGGLYRENSHEVVEKQHNFIEDLDLQNISEKLIKLLRNMNYKPYDEDKLTGLLRHMVLRKSSYNSEIMLTLVASNNIIPGKKELIKKILEIDNRIVSIYLNHNNRQDSAILSDKFIKLYGKDRIIENIDGLYFYISPGSFFQVNPGIAKMLYRYVVEKTQLSKNDIVVDAYSGTGTIGSLISKKVKRVICVENSKSYFDAEESKRENRLKNLFLYKMDATEFLEKLVEAKECPDVVVLDPPRSGASKRFIDAINKLKPNKVIYVSCDPKTLKRDVVQLSKTYRLNSLKPFDMFSFTKDHLETVAILSKK